MLDLMCFEACDFSSFIQFIKCVSVCFYFDKTHPWPFGRMLAWYAIGWGLTLDQVKTKGLKNGAFFSSLAFSLLGKIM